MEVWVTTERRYNMNKIYWYRAHLYINRRFCQHIFLKSDSADYARGDKIIKRFYNGFLVTIEVLHSFGTEKPADLIELDKIARAPAFPVIISEV